MDEFEQQVILIADLGFGDAGKGSITDFLTREKRAHTIVRYNGGAQAAHNVVTPDGRHHTFAQFGSGSFVDGVKTHLSKFMLLDPLSMVNEGTHLQSLGVTDIFNRTTIDEGALIITPFQQIVNRLKETARGDGRHGSCGMGIGETMSDFLTLNDILFAGDLLDRKTTRRKLKFLQEVQISKLQDILESLPKTEWVQNELSDLYDPETVDYLVDEYTDFISLLEIVDGSYLESLLKRPSTVIFEGAQGVLLDEKYGFYPYTTWTNTTFRNADLLLEEQNYQGKKLRLGLMRGYSTRHGVGPFVTEDPELTKALPDLHNITNNWQGNLRAGYLDLVMTRYSLEVLGGVDGLVLSHLDRMTAVPKWQLATSYRCPGLVSPNEYFIGCSDKATGIKVHRPTNTDHQGVLTRLLEQCTPTYLEAVTHGDREGYTSFIEGELKLPIALTSSGLTATDKKWRHWI